MTVDDRLECIERRLQAAEDRSEILELIAAYGPLVDSGLADEAAGLWCAGGGYGIFDPSSGAHRIEAPEDLAKMYRAPANLDMIRAGCGHFVTMPNLAIEGDRAEAVGYTFVARYDGEGWPVWRAAVNRWLLQRTSQGWRIGERFNRVLDGSDEAQAIMRRVADLREVQEI